MRTIREVLRLKYQCGLPNSDIAASCRIGETTVREYLRRATLANLTWPLPEALQDAALDQLLYPPPVVTAVADRALPDWPEVHKQLKRKGVTLQLLVEEYRRDHPTGYAYSQFCKLYREWARTQHPTMIQEHKAGDKLFVDYAGHTMPITDPKTGEVKMAQIFVAALGASNYTFAEATPTQSLPDWIGSHIRCFTFLGGVPRVVVPDNLKSGVTSPCRYEPDINPTYLKLANHYGIAVVPARVRKPRDKAKAENAVLQVERHILARLRNHTFHSLAELNQALLALLHLHNDQATKSLGSSRTALFKSIDEPALRPLPENPFAEGEWSRARVNLDYHVVIESHRYSVPYTNIGKSVDVRLTEAVVEIYASNERVAVHKRSYASNGFTTVAAHMPPQHRHANWQEDQFLAAARKHGPHTEQLIAAVIASRPVREQTYRSCLGILRLADEYGSERMEDAALRAVISQIATYKSVQAILKHGLDRMPLPAEQIDAPPIVHDNIRGADYYSAHTRAEAKNA
ncbi:MAG: IS21 family transposase [Thermoanaerobaculia bacterium]